MSNSALAEELLKINSDTLGASGKEEYDSLTGKIYPRVCESLYATSQKNYQVANYDTAVTNLEQVVQMDEGYQDGAAMLFLHSPMKNRVSRIRRIRIIRRSSKNITGQRQQQMHRMLLMYKMPKRPKDKIIRKCTKEKDIHGKVYVLFFYT